MKGHDNAKDMTHAQLKGALMPERTRGTVPPPPFPTGA